MWDVDVLYRVFVSSASLDCGKSKILPMFLRGINWPTAFSNSLEMKIADNKRQTMQIPTGRAKVELLKSG